jgi:hypothetical protein
MPRPSRSKVASTNQRVLASPSELLDKSKDNATSMATQKTKKGRPPVKKAAERAAPGVKETEPATTITRPRGRMAAKRVVADEGQKGALDALRARRDAALKAKDKKSPVARPAAPTTIVHKNIHKTVQTSSTPAKIAARSATPRSKPTKSVNHPLRRDRTPSAQPGTDEDLYGLSPAGEASRLRLETRRQSTQQAPQSALKAQGTPAVETSILALANFKRRPRQPSIIRMVQQTSELGDQSDFDAMLDETLRDFDEFNPDDESTPLHLNKRKSGGPSASKSHGNSLPGIHTSSSRKRKHTNVEDDVQVPRSPSLASSPPPIVTRTLSDPHSTSSSNLPEHIIPSTEQEARQDPEPERYSDTMAPPRSSSEFSSPLKVVDLANKRRKTARGAVEGPHLTKRNVERRKAPALSTATLQSLLPKAPRKKRNAAKVDPYDIPSSDPTEPSILEDSDDGDELAQTTGRRRGNTAPFRTPIRRIDANRATKGKASGTMRRSVKVPATKEKQRRTYGRAQRAESEKENDDTLVISDNESDSSSDDAGTRGKKQRDSGVCMVSSKELQEVRKKFEEVDEWEMEFESVDLGGGATSSPYR